MIMNMNEKGRQTKLLAAIAVLAMVVCALAVVLPADEANAADPVEPTAISDYDGLEKALTSSTDGSYELTADITGSYSKAITVTNNITIDMNGHDVAITASDDSTFLIIRSENADTASLTITSSNTAAEKDVFSVTGDALVVNRAIFSIEQNGTMNVDNVKLVTSASTLYPNGQASSLTVTDSRIDGGCYAIGTNNAVSGNNKVNITVTNSVLDTGYGYTESNKGDNCTVIINIPNAILNISESELSGDRQVLFVRCGTATVTNTTINFTATFEDDPYDPVTGVKWGSGNEVTSAAVVVGDYGNDNAYTGNAILNLNGCTINANGGTPVFISSDGDTKATYNETNTSVSGDIETVVSNVNDLESAMENSSVDSIVYNGTAPITTKITKDVTVTNVSAIGTSTVVGEKGSITLESDSDVSIDTTGVTVNYSTGGSVKIAATSGTFTAASIVFYYGSEGISIDKGQGNATITFDKDTGKISGSITSGIVKIDGTGTVTIDGKLTLGNGATLSIGSGVTFKAGSGLVGPTGDGEKATISVAGVFEYTSVPDTISVEKTGNGVIKVEGGQGTENIISVSQSVNGTYYLTADTTILSGVTFTVPRNAVLNLMGYDLIVEGTLVVENRGTVTSGVGDITNATAGNIVLTTTGSIQNEGTIGDRMPINISNGANEAESQVISMKGVTGVSIQLVRTIEGTDRVYNMAVSGDVSAVRGVDGPELTLTNVDINGSMTIARDISMTVDGITDVTGNGTVVTINGSMTTTGGTFTLNNGTSAVLNGHVIGKINAKVGVMNDQGELIDSVNEPAASVSFTDSADESYTVGMTISVNRVTVPQDDGTSDIYQRMFVDGAVKAANDDRTVEPESEVAFTGNVYITDSLTLTDVTVSSGSYTMMVSEGGVVETLQDDIVYNGAKYAIEADTATDPETYYYTTFDGAMQSIATAMDGIVYVNGDFTITGTYTVADNQEIAVDPNSTGIGVKVGEGSTITVELGGVVDDLAFYQILGKVVVAEGDGYAPDATYPGSSPVQYIYAVMTEDSETYDVTYSGFKTAMDEAQAGQTITVVGNAEYDGDLVIPNGVTVQVNEDLTLTVTGDVTIENGGKLVLDASTLAVGEIVDGVASENTVTVAGELDASEAGSIVAVCDDTNTSLRADVDVYSTGTLTSMTVVGGNGVTMNAAYYNDGGEYVYTSLANAVAYAEKNALPYAIHVTGTFTETGTVESDGVDIEVDNGADVTLGDLRLNDAKIGPATEGTGKYTATVTALNGAGDAAVDATVAVTKTTATVESKVTLNAEGTSQYALQIDDLANANVQAGTVTFVGNSITVSKDAGLTISSGATLLIGENAILVDNEGMMVNNGTVSIAEKKTLTVKGTTSTGADTVGTLVGNVNVPKDATLKAESGIIVTGTVTVDADGTFTVTGALQVGAAPGLLSDTASGAIVGEVTIGASNTDYVLAFAGADLSQADIVNASYTDLKSTAYQINGIDFATVYTFGSVNLNTVNDDVQKLKDLNTDDSDGNYAGISWYADGQVVSFDGTPAVNNNVGEYAQVTTEIRYNTVDVTVSEGPQITISIDGVVWNGINPLELTIGTHTVSAVVNPGYTGEITITFNGQTVTNGQFEITSDMMDSLDQIVLSATGNITQDSTVVVDGGNQGGSDGLGLTDYLLIVLVILIVIMAIIVALRLMRS